MQPPPFQKPSDFQAILVPTVANIQARIQSPAMNVNYQPMFLVHTKNTINPRPREGSEMGLVKQDKIEYASFFVPRKGAIQPI